MGAPSIFSTLIFVLTIWSSSAKEVGHTLRGAAVFLIKRIICFFIILKKLMLAKKWHSLNVWLKKKKIHYNWGKNTIKRLLFTTHSMSLWLVIQNYQLNDLCECKCSVHWQYNLFAISKKCISGWGFSKGSGTCRMLTSILIFFFFFI